MDINKTTQKEKEKDFKLKFEYKLMELRHLRTIITIVATIIGISAVVLNYFFPKYALLIFGLEVLILPTIYIIGNIYIEEQIKKEYEENIQSIEEKYQDLREENDVQDYIIRELDSKNKSLKNELKNAQKKK